MARQKATGLNPRECLKNVLYDRWQAQVAIPQGACPSRSRILPAHECLLFTRNEPHLLSSHHIIICSY